MIPLGEKVSFAKAVLIAVPVRGYHGEEDIAWGDQRCDKTETEPSQRVMRAERATTDTGRDAE